MGRRFTKKRYDPNRVPRARRVVVNEKNVLLPFLFTTLNEQSKSSVKAMLAHGQISVNGQVTAQFDTPLEPNDVVTISYERGRVAFSHPLLKIVWEDNHLILVQKKEGLLSVGNARERDLTVVQLLNKYVKKSDERNKIFVLHRLDKETSGLMLFARNKGMQETFQNNWNRLVKEHSFIAVVEGVPEKKSDLLITQDWDAMTDNKLIIAEGEGEDAIARYKLLKQNEQYALLNVRLESGRRNHIRNQLAAMGHPIAGDRRNGAETNPAERLMLHSQIFTFVHPETRTEMTFDTRMPFDFTSLTK